MLSRSRALIALLALTTASACGPNRSPKVSSTHDALTQSLGESAPELRPLIQQFYDEAAKRGVTLPEWRSRGSFIEDEEIGDTPETRSFAARCYQFSDHHFEFRRYSWNRMNPLMHRWVVFHELGHCILGRDHQDAPVTVSFEVACRKGAIEMPTSMPSSIMASADQIDISSYMKGWKAYVDELFTRQAVDLSALAIAPERKAEIDANWRKILEPVLERFDAEAARFGAKLPRTRLDQDKGAFVASVSRERGEALLGAGFLAQRVCQSDPGPELRESADEATIFAEIARVMLEPSARGALPGRWDGIGSATFDPKFFSDYASHRDELLKELFAQPQPEPQQPQP